VRGQRLTVGADDKQAFPVHLVVAVDQTLQRSIGYSGFIGQRGQLPVPFCAKFGGSTV
jgi:hypothetical protein